MTGAARVEVALRAGAELGEGPTWDPAGRRLLWADILGSRIHTYDPVSGHRTVRTTEQHVGAAKPRAGGGTVVNLRDGVGLYDPDGSFRWLHRDPVAGRRGNDAAVAPDGSLWYGTMRYDETAGGGTLTRIDADGATTTVLDDVAVSNGTGWSPDGSLMYYIDSPTGRIDVFTMDGTRATDRRTFAVVAKGEGFPDGLCVDAGGYVWVALWDGGAVRRYAPDGTLDRTVEMPVARPTACAFGGEQLTDLYITTAAIGDPHPLAGSLFVVRDAGLGLPQAAFKG
ncbi:SMP-30/gluconolactonase/LRE family protein [Streptomyces sp. TRM66268-LWL]|uniref:SMP-30/gluconolactonase/LRE family protein n=1 Tax=Streptomyces polyasparticus TaxID=2767826 RepID=A0ABR7SPY0_9ACTN|nr:SMP-30/gluconolactonase/LRE family protein [Streptomyces polyasparticus]MBC9716904.1 SMP-30/gluconolactonase/LRE family protein [Streptomyces polyasparticus]